MKCFFSVVFLLFIFATNVQADDFVPADEDDLSISANVFTLDGDNTGGAIELRFGEVLGEYLRWDDANARFSLSADLDLALAQLTTARLENLAIQPICNPASTGRVYFDTADSAPFVCNGTSWEQLGTISTQPLATARLRDTSTTNINAAATDNLVPWDTQDFSDPVFVHDTVTNNSRVQVDDSGKYLVSGAVTYTSTSARYNGKAKFRINGTTTLSPTFESGYIRSASGHNESSLPFSIILDLNANDYFEVLVDRESTTGAANLISGASSLSVLQLQTVVSGGSSGGGAPFVDTGLNLIMSPSDTQTLTLTGSGFLPTSTVSLPGFGGTINSTTVVGPGQIDINVTADAVQSAYDIIVDNSGNDNTVWPGNGVGQFEVASITGTGVAGTYTEGFEAGLGSWVDAGLDVAWTRNSGGTPSTGTGPNAAASGTFYMYTETSNPNNPNFTFGLETTDFAVAQSISFDYHMYGGSVGDLEVQTLFRGTWTTRFTLSGQQQAAQGDPYLNQFIDLSTFNVEGIRFQYTSGASWDGDAAIDNVEIIST